MTPALPPSLQAAMPTALPPAMHPSVAVALVAQLRRIENVLIAKSLQLEAARRRAVPSALISSPVPSLKSLSLSVALLDRFYCLYVTLCCDLEL